MIYTISNDKLCVKISDFGAELQSVTDLADGCEYIWQGDAKYWDDRAPTLFPICGRFTEQTPLPKRAVPSPPSVSTKIPCLRVFCRAMI